MKEKENNPLNTNNGQIIVTQTVSTKSANGGKNNERR